MCEIMKKPSSNKVEIEINKSDEKWLLLFDKICINL